ncbi:Uncharacterized protein SCF082_LOCUS29620, partial [Durusdinium trenchii]
SSPADVPVPTARPSPTSAGAFLDEAILGPLPVLSSALGPASSALVSPSDMPVPTYVPSPTEEIFVEELPTESVPVQSQREPTESVPSEPTKTLPTHSVVPTRLPTRVPTRSVEGTRLPPSSPADLPVPTQMPSPTQAFGDEEALDLAPVASPGVSARQSSGFSMMLDSAIASPSMPVPTERPSPTSLPEVVEVPDDLPGAPEMGESASAPFSSMPMRSPSEMPVPTEMPTEMASPYSVPQPEVPTGEVATATIG